MESQKVFKPVGKTLVLCDYREREVAEALKTYGAIVTSSALPVGDCICSDRVVVERKDHGDFVSSIIDGRIFEQAQRMREQFEKPVFIIEGSSNRDISMNALKAALATLATQYGASVLNTKNEKDTALTIFWLAKKEQHEAGRGIALKVGRKPKETGRLQEEIVCGLPGVRTVLCKRLLERFGTMAKVFGASEDDLAQVKGVGKKHAKKLYELINKRYEPDKRTREYDYKSPVDVAVAIRRDFPGAELEPDRRMRMFDRYIHLLRDGKKSTTVRYRKDKIRYPALRTLPLVETNPDKDMAGESDANQVGWVDIARVTVKRFSELDSNDAKRDGFLEAHDLKDSLRKIYGEIADEEIVSIYYISSFHPMNQET
jgi:ERCC4-type nuclease